MGSTTTWADAAADSLDPTPDPYLYDPAGWVRNRTGEHMWSRQVTLLESVRDHRRTAVPAAHGPGKSWSAARAALWFLDTHPPGSAFVVTSAPTAHQVHAILWREIGRAHGMAGMAGEVLQTDEMKLGGELVAFGRKPPDRKIEQFFQGIHARYLLVILDEAGGIPKALWTAAGSLMTNDDARLLAVGNPDDPTAEFAQVCDGADPVTGGTSARGWHVLPISAFHTPAVTGEAISAELAENLTSRRWMEEHANDVGGPTLVDAHRTLLDRIDAGADLDAAYRGLDDQTRQTINESPLYVAKVLGRFPGDTTDGVVLWSWLRACTRHPADGVRDTGPVELGIDVGGSETGDETVIYERRGPRVGRRWSIRSADPEQVTDRCLEAIDTAQPAAVKIDSIGIGWGVMGSIRHQRPGLHVVGVNVGEAASEPSRFLNLRAEIWWDVARGLSKDQAWNLSGVPEGTLSELAAPRWSENKSGRIVVESKDEIRKRLGRSTDNADALLLAFYHAGAPMTWTSPADMPMPRMPGRGRRR